MRARCGAHVTRGFMYPLSVQALFAAVERISHLPPQDAEDVSVNSMDVVLSNPMRAQPPSHAPTSPGMRPVPPQQPPHTPSEHLSASTASATATASAVKPYVAPLLKEQAIELPQQLRVIGVGEIGGELRAWAAEGAVALGLLKFAWFRMSPQHAATFNANPLGCEV